MRLIMPPRRVLLTEADGFLGRHLLAPFEQASSQGGWVVRCTSRTAKHRSDDGAREWVSVDVDDGDTLAAALEGCEAAVYLAPPSWSGAREEERERERAARFGLAAARAGLRRIVYVGGVAPVGHPSHHLRARGGIGRALRASGVSTVELRPGLIIGAGGESWNIVRDVAVRLPLLPDAPWTSSELEPIAVDDVALAVARAVDVGDEASAVYGLPGAERMSARCFVERVAALAGRRPRFLQTPVLPTPLAAHALPLFTRTDPRVARELLEGLRADLISQTPSFWSLLGDVVLLPFDVAVRRALNEDHVTLPLRTRAFERLVDRMTPWARG